MVGDVFFETDFFFCTWPNRECAQRIHMTATSLSMLRLAWDFETNLLHLPVFLHLRTRSLPPAVSMRSDPQQKRFERGQNKHERMQRRRS